MCYHPISIINPTKYVSVKYRDRFVIQVPCGKCAACRMAKSNEWTYRLFQEAKDTFENGFVMFDTLTYADKYLPHISDYLAIPKEIDFPCFSSDDLRLFVSNLRQRCKRKFNSNFKYFIAGEYGTSEYHLHRPHYHALFFVTGDISPYQFSALVADTWSKGRTDGIPFQSAKHVDDNTFRSFSPNALRSLKYVCKYIQKDSLFEKQIDIRLNRIMSRIADVFVLQGLESWPSSSHYWRVRESISRKISQFHRQSTHLGESALGDFDISELIETGSLVMPDNISVRKSIPLFTYYKRKLFYDLLDVDGSKVWIPNNVGKKYLLQREFDRIIYTSDLLRAAQSQLKLSFNLQDLSDYVVKYRGRFVSFLGSSDFEDFEDRISNPTHFCYVDRYAKEWFGSVGVSLGFAGNSHIGFSRIRPKLMRINDFIRKYVYFNPDYEAILSKIYDFHKEFDVGRQKLFEFQQRLKNLVHHFYYS